MPTTKSQALTAAEQVSSFFLAFPEVLDVYLFGSIAREGDHPDSDVDLIISVYGDMAVAFVKACLQPINGRDGFYVGSASIRFFAAMRLLGLDLEERDELCERKQGLKLDLFLLQQDWRDCLPELQASLPHGDPAFMANIARDAKRFNGLTMQFESN